MGYTDDFGNYYPDPGEQEELVQRALEKKAADAARKAEFRAVDPTGGLGDFGRQGLHGYRDTGRRMSELGQLLEARMNGADSISAARMRQGVGQAQSAAQSAAQGGRAGDRGMAMRRAAAGAGRAHSQLSGQTAMAGIDERAKAGSQFGQLLARKRQQDMRAGMGGLTAIERARSDRFAVDNGQAPGLSGFDRAMGLVSAGTQWYAQQPGSKQPDPSPSGWGKTIDPLG